MTRVKTWVASVLAAGMVFGFATPARAGLYNSITTGVTTVAGIGAAVLLLMGKDGKAEKADPEAVTTKASLLYLRDNHLQLVQDLSRGEGPVMQDLASAAGIHPENRARFGLCMQAHARELIELSAPESLDGHRTVRFLQRYLEIAGADQVLAGDLLAASS